MKRQTLALRLAMVAAALLLSGAAQADGLVTNGGFETGDFTGWTQFGNTGFSGVDDNNPHSGSFAAFFGPVGSLGGISQAIATNPGGQYAVDFWLANEGGTPSEFVFNWDGGVAETDLVNPGAFGYTHFTYNLTATLPSTLISFSFRQDPAFLFLDDVRVVPEPTTLALLGLGLAGLGFARRKNAC